MECDTENDCSVPEASNCNIMLKPTLSGKMGYCVPTMCQSDVDCFKIGDECANGSLSGTCNSRKDRGTCEYDPVLLIASCGKKSTTLH